MTAFRTATLNCDGPILGLGEMQECPGWLDEDISRIADLRKVAARYGWTRDGAYDFCAAHSAIRAGGSSSGDHP